MAERLLRVRTRQKSKKPEFNFHDSHKKKRLGTSWRKPRGLHNKLRQQVAAKGKLVRVGYGSPKAVRGFHPCGLPEVLVNNVAELERAQGSVVRIASGVGMKKRLEIQTKATASGIKILNPKGGA
ncbi:MAG: 50S ribosomal protein L32e [Methanosaeta sp. PtaU1.Bin112]|nr:MAG: 50S ribosomal protein L32e [Methanosaeta sp. PtaU1.Bin112]